MTLLSMACRIYDDFSLLLFLHAHREASALSNEIPEESEQFRFLRAACFANIKGSVDLILAKASAMRISIPLDLSSRSFIYTTTVFHVLDVLHHFYFLPSFFSSTFCLRGTCGVFLIQAISAFSDFI